MARNDWSELDLRTRSTMGPYDDELIILHLVPKDSGGMEMFVVGRMVTEEGKSWLRAYSGYYWNIADKKKRYRIEWVHLPPTDRRELTL